jgi:hypothetical protein
MITTTTYRKPRQLGSVSKLVRLMEALIEQLTVGFHKLKAQRNKKQQSVSLENHCASLFRQLIYHWYQDAASEQVELLAAELAARFAAQQGSVCLGLMRLETVPRLFGLVFFLDSYGLTLRQRYRTSRDGVYIFLDKRGESSSDFVGTTVREQTKLAQAA